AAFAAAGCSLEGGVAVQAQIGLELKEAQQSLLSSERDEPGVELTTRRTDRDRIVDPRSPSKRIIDHVAHGLSCRREHAAALALRHVAHTSVRCAVNVTR